jgi:hypothetical protein
VAHVAIALTLYVRVVVATCQAALIEKEWLCKSDFVLAGPLIVEGFPLNCKLLRTVIGFLID